MIILASKSPRRKELLKEIFPNFIIIPSNIDESKYELTDLSLEKAKEIGLEHPNDIIISADTIVILNNVVYGKPKDQRDAYRMLKELSGKMHIVKTVYTILCINKKIQLTRQISSKVYFNELSDQLINDYISSGSPLDKAGAYGVQDNHNYPIISHIEGSYSNIVGLPIDELKKDLEDLKIIA